MSAVVTFDPFEELPFHGYLEPSTGKQEKYWSLAQFFHAERLRGVDQQYRKYILQLEDPEMFRLEVEGVGISGEVAVGWEAAQARVLYAGLYMQAMSNRSQYGHYVSNAQNLCVADFASSQETAEALGDFISDISSGEEQLKVMFLGEGADEEYMRECLSVIFAKKRPHCLFALEGDGCASFISGYAQSLYSPFALIDESLSNSSVAENLAKRVSHIFRFLGSDDSPRIAGIVSELESRGCAVRPIQQKTT